MHGRVKQKINVEPCAFFEEHFHVCFCLSVGNLARQHAREKGKYIAEMIARFIKQTIEVVTSNQYFLASNGLSLSSYQATIATPSGEILEGS